jgi:hypothetical protein
MSRVERHLGLVWSRRQAASSKAVEPTPLGNLRPSDEDLSALVDLARRGRIRILLERLDTLEAKDAQLRPWLEHMRGLVRSYQIKAAQEFLHNQQRP